jgi:hypothetical protein
MNSTTITLQELTSLSCSKLPSKGITNQPRTAGSTFSTFTKHNYPLYKNPWYFDGNNGINNEEYSPKVLSGTFLGQDFRNKATWWGLNQWGIDSSSDIYKPLAYLAVMSFGFDNIKPLCRTGHYPPFDGYRFDHLSSFCNFTHSAISVNLPKSYILLIGAILWRMKESGLLEYEGIKRTKNDPSTEVKPGWNSYNVSDRKSVV